MPLAAAAGTPMPANNTARTLQSETGSIAAQRGCVVSHLLAFAQLASLLAMFACFVERGRSCWHVAVGPAATCQQEDAACADSDPPGMQLSPHTVSPGTGVEFPGQPAPFAAEMAGPAQHNTTQHKTPQTNHESQGPKFCMRSRSCMRLFLPAYRHRAVQCTRQAEYQV